MGQNVFPLPPATTDLTKMTYNTYNYINPTSLSVPAAAGAGTKPYGSADLFTINGAGVLTELQLYQSFSNGLGFVIVVDGVEKQLFNDPPSGSSYAATPMHAGYYTLYSSTTSYNYVLDRSGLFVRFNSSLALRAKNLTTSVMTINIANNIVAALAYYT